MKNTQIMVLAALFPTKQRLKIIALYVICLTKHYTDKCRKSSKIPAFLRHFQIYSLALSIS
jgi:hypothetical protein